MPKTAIAIRHLHFEDLGTFAPVLAGHGYEVRYLDAWADELAALDPTGPDLLVVLGGPIGVYEEDRYPLLSDELRVLRARLEADRPMLGICLGAQLMASAMGANVYPTGIKEIGFGAVSLTEAGCSGPLRHLAGTPVLHWHGDTFDIPDGCELLASTDVCRNQAFARGDYVLALQFHPEADPSRLEPWLIGHTAELGGAGIDPRRLRSEAAQAGAALGDSARLMFSEWLARLP